MCTDILYRHGAKSTDFEAVEFGEDLLGRVCGLSGGLVPRPALVRRSAAAADVLRPLAVHEAQFLLTGNNTH